MTARTPAEVAAEARGVEVISEHRTQIGGVTVTFTVGRITKTKPPAARPQDGGGA